jgi:hypothetical protein
MFASHIHRREGERERGKRKGGKIQPIKYLHKGVIGSKLIPSTN